MTHLSAVHPFVKKSYDITRTGNEFIDIFRPISDTGRYVVLRLIQAAREMDNDENVCRAFLFSGLLV
jgi:hypothetical protein